MDGLIYASAIAVILIGIFFPSLRPERSAFLPKRSLNVERCIELHNEIVRLGWEGMGHAPEDYNPRTWTEHHGANADKAGRELSKDLVAFLRGAYELGTEQHFHYYARGLLYPGDDMFALIDHLCGYKEEQVNMYDGYHRRLESRKLARYVRLYSATSIASHPEGLIFDQHTNTAIMCMSIHDGDGLCQPDRLKWYPLEDILAAWRDMIRVGKVKAEPPGVESNPYRALKYDPWVLLPYSDRQMDEAVTMFNALVDAIETRMPNLDAPVQPSNTTLLDGNALAAAHIPPGFAFEFLSKVRRPRFRFIAPGLEVPTQNSSTDQPFFGMTDTIPEHYRDDTMTPPILLLRSSLAYKRPPHPPWTSPDIFGWPFNASTFPAGLYFHATWSSANPHDDQVTLVLPYAIGANGWARKSDGTMFGEKVSEYDPPRAHNVHAELYQTGHQPFIEMHAVRLVKVLHSWLAMVQRGDWRVGKEGVENGIGEWKKADTRGGWEKYWVPPDW